jgi:hypothetical protein
MSRRGFRIAVMGYTFYQCRYLISDIGGNGQWAMGNGQWAMMAILQAGDTA